MTVEGLDDYFLFAGAVPWDQVPGCMLNADFCLSLDRRTEENLEYRRVIGVTQIKVYEYLALGKPVLAHDLGDGKEFFETRRIGWVCDPQPERVAQRIIEIAERPAQIAEYSQNALRLAQEKYNWKVTAGKIAAFLPETAETTEGKR